MDVEEFSGLGQALANTDVSAVFDVTNNQPIIVARAMYLDVPGQFFVAGRESAGIIAPATEWFLAEGATGKYFDLFVLIANPGATDAQVEAVNRAVDGWANAPFHVETMASPSGRQVVATARKYIAQKGIKLLGIDYVQLMSNGRKEIREDVTVSSNAIRSISLGYKIPTLVACQMSRNIEHRGKDAEPMLVTPASAALAALRAEER